MCIAVCSSTMAICRNCWVAHSSELVSIPQPEGWFTKRTAAATHCIPDALVLVKQILSVVILLSV
jgi:hypothetical protein